MEPPLSAAPAGPGASGRLVPGRAAPVTLVPRLRGHVIARLVHVDPLDLTNTRFIFWFDG